MASPAALGPVVKADGYGHGLEMAARCAVSAGVGWLCVADSAEAVRLRADGYEGRIFVLYPVPPSMWPEMTGFDIDVTVGDSAQAREMVRASLGDRPLRVHVETDTGMTRGGVRVDEVVVTARTLADGPGVELAGVWTHLAAPEDPEITEAQLDRFDSALDDLATAGLDPGVVHAAASGGLLASDTSRHGLVRPGLAFYGLHPGAGAPLPPSVGPALSVRAHPVRVMEAATGTRVGYAGTWIAKRPSVIATLPIGYADGWSRSSSPGTSVIVGGRRAPVVGRVSSDSLTVDVTGIEDVGTDSEFTLIGTDGPETITADEVAGVRGTISWEVLQQLGSRLTRVYMSDSDPVAVRLESTIDIVTGDETLIPHY
jgi:alanine racemase